MRFSVLDEWRKSRSQVLLTMTLPLHSVFVATVCFLLSAMAAEENQALRVRGIEGRVAVYATTNRLREAVAWLPSGAEFSVRGDLSDEDVWVRIEPPESVSVWVYRELVREGVVQADKVRVRAGAGLNGRPVGTLNKGDRVEVRGTYGDWLRIKPPPGSDFWVLRDQVEQLAVMPSEGAGDATGVSPGAAAGLQGVATNGALASLAGGVTNAAAMPLLAVRPPPELSGYALVSAPGQGQRVSLTGLLDWGTVGAVEAPFCLIEQTAEGETRPVCHLLARTTEAKPLVGAAVTVEGTRWLVKGSELPVIVAESVRALPSPSF